MDEIEALLHTIRTFYAKLEQLHGTRTELPCEVTESFPSACQRCPYFYKFVAYWLSIPTSFWQNLHASPVDEFSQHVREELLGCSYDTIGAHMCLLEEVA